MSTPRLVRRALLAWSLWFAVHSSGVAAMRAPWLAGWEFHRGETTIEAAQSAPPGAAGWQAVTLPHDWSIAGMPSEDAPATGHGGFFPTGSGWYRHRFDAPAEWRGRVVELTFEAAYMNAEVWINGVSVARQPYGFIPFRADLTPHLRLGGTNFVVVRLDNSAQPNARFYTGSGLIRPVTLEVAAPTRLAPDGVFVTTEELTATAARVRLAAEVILPPELAADAEISHRVISPEGATVATATASLPRDEKGRAVATSLMTIPTPAPWTPESPRCYRAVTTLRVNGQVVDEVATVFGVRTIRVSAERGFELNGALLELNGGNVHHDHGPLGAAAFPAAEYRKVELLKAAGFNAVRTAHNPPSRAFLEACDRLGLLVINEIFDGWAKAKTKHDYSTLFVAWWQRDLDAWVRAHRNHPSIVMWSVGNEMFERGNAEGLRLTRELAARVRQLDPTRPVTAGVNGLGASGKWEKLDPLFAALDVAGYNYELQNHVDDHARVPGRVIVAAESYQSEVFANWLATQRHACVVGDFVWSAQDYLGEAGIGRVFAPGETVRKHWEGSHWPWHGAACGDLDLTGWRKPISHYRAIVWDRGERLHASVVAPVPGGGEWSVTPWSLPPALPSWTWDVAAGTPVQVDVASRHERVRLLLNGRTIGEAATGEAEQFRARFTVPYDPGELVAVGLEAGVERERFTLRTAGAPHGLRVTADRLSIATGGQDLVFLTIEAVDAQGQWCPQATLPVEITLDGPATLAGYGTGDVTRATNYQAPVRPLHQGRALAVVRSTSDSGRIVVRFAAPGVPTTEIVLASSPVTAR